MTNTSTARRLNTRQLADKLGELDFQITGMEAITAAYLNTFGAGTLSHQAADAWNAATDALEELKARRTYVAQNRRPYTGAESATRALIAANID